MKRGIVRLVAVAAMAAIWGVAHAAETPVSVSLTISHPKESAKKTSDPKSRSAALHGIPHAEVKDATYDYTGKISCAVPKDKTTKVTLEAYFITRALSKGAKDELDERVEIETFEFGGDNPKQYKFNLTSPAISQTTLREGPNFWNAGNADKQKLGTRLMGVIVRAMVDGKPVKVISEPSNSRWTAAGKKATVELD